MYVYADDWIGMDICPQEGETYAAFTARVTPAVLALRPDIDPQRLHDRIEGAWANYVLATATEATITVKREFNAPGIYSEGWFDDWCIAELHSAKAINITYSSVEKAKAGTGESVHIAKTIPEKQQVFGWANISKTADGQFPIDWDGDVTLPTELENAAYTYVLKYRGMGEQHEEDSYKGELIESMMFTKEKMAALGIPEGIVPEGWWVGFHVPDKEVFAKIKKGEYGMFSVEGKAKRVPTGQ